MPLRNANEAAAWKPALSSETGSCLNNINHLFKEGTSILSVQIMRVLFICSSRHWFFVGHPAVDNRTPLAGCFN